MSKIEEFKFEIEKLGFEIEGDVFTLTQVQRQQMFVNGRPMVQENKHELKLEYIGDGCEVDDEGNDIEGTEMIGLNIIQDDVLRETIYIRDFNEFKEYIS